MVMYMPIMEKALSEKMCMEPLVINGYEFYVIEYPGEPVEAVKPETK